MINQSVESLYGLTGSETVDRSIHAVIDKTVNGDTGVLLLVTRIWDAVSDPMMGAVADRTKTRWGKYRPYLLWVAAPFSICGILLFTTPDWGYAARLIWADGSTGGTV